MNSTFTVTTDVFEGPLSALLELIEKRKLSINEVTLADVTDDYISYIKNVQEYSMNDTSAFIVVAATLMLIKSKSLIPELSITEEEKTEIDVLEKRLEVFQVVKAVSGFIRERFGKTLLYRRPFVRIKKKFFNPSGLSPENLEEAAYIALASVPKEFAVPKTEVKQIIRIEEVLNRLLERVQRGASFSFKEFAKKGIEGNKREVKNFLVVSFLAMLELIKNGTLDATQNDTYSDITLSS